MVEIEPLRIQIDLEQDGRFLASVPDLPGVMAYGATKQDALRRLYAVALRTLADSVEEGAMLAPVSRLFGYGVAHR